MKKLFLVALLVLILCNIVFAKMYKIEWIWDKNSEEDLAGYTFYQGDPNFDNYEVILNDIPKDANTCITDCNFPVGMTAYFAITAFNDKGSESDFSNIVPFTAENMSPVAAGQSIATDKNKALDIVLTASDFDNDSLIYSIYSNPLYGEITGTPPNITYTPNKDFAGADNLMFKVNDGTIDSNIASVSILVRDIKPDKPSNFKILNCIPIPGL